MNPTVSSLHTAIQESTFAGNITGPVASYNTSTVNVFSSGHQDFRHFLSPLFPEDRYSSIVQRLVPGTGKWFLGLPEIASWRDGHSSQVLCCTGPPGVGKSSLFCRLVEKLREDNIANNYAVLILFGDYQEKSPHTGVQLVGALLTQLLGQLKQQNPYSQELQQIFIRREHLLITTARRYLEKIISAKHFSKVYICIDALDELDTTAQDDLLQTCVQLCCQSPAVKLLLTGRNNAGVDSAIENIITHEFPKISITHIPLTVESNSLDVRLFLKQKIGLDRRRKAMNDSLREDILQTLSGSNFLVASLSVEAILEKATIKRRKESLSTHVANLDVAFERTLARVKAQPGDGAHLGMEVIRWMLLSKRLLTIQELSYALAVELGSNDLNFEEDVPDSIIDYTLGLVQVASDGVAEIPRFVHSTFQEYLTRYQDTLFPDGHTRLALVTLTYLSFDAMGLSDPLVRFDRDGDLHPLVNYASNYWGEHARESSMSIIVEFACGFLQSSKFTVGLSTVRSSLDRDRDWDTIGLRLKTPHSALHEAAYFATTSILLALLSSDTTRINDRDVDGRTPLIWAARKGHTDVVQLLLGHVNIEPDLADNLERTPLSHAAEQGHSKIVELLLNTKAVSVHSVDNNARTPFSHAAGNGWTQVIELLLAESESVANSADFLHRSPLSHAARKGQIDVVDLLLRKNAAIDSVDTEGRTPLSFAAEQGEVEVVRLFLEKSKAVADSRDNLGRTPLSYAAEQGQRAVVELLLDRVDVVADSIDNDGRTPLSHAAQSGSKDVIELLLQRRGVSASSVDRFGRNPFSYALQRGQLDILQLQWNNAAGNSVNSVSGWGPSQNLDPLGDQQPSFVESFQADWMDFYNSEPLSSSQASGFKRTVASKKMVDASAKRRKHAARFECHICTQTFTARHNLNNHLNSHYGIKAPHCRYCGQRATTAAACARHERSACKKNPQSKKK